MATSIVGAMAVSGPAFAFRTGGDLEELDGTEQVRWAEPIDAESRQQALHRPRLGLHHHLDHRRRRELCGA
jgi:hypothetical protein